MTDTLLVVDAPGGPHPSLFLPVLQTEFEVHVLALDPAPARAAALATARTVMTVGTPAAVEAQTLDRIHAIGAAGVVAFSERIVHAVQRAAWQAGRPANAPDVLEALQDKRTQRKRLRAGGLDTPEQVTLRTLADCHNTARTFRFPAVLKPAVSMGSVATFRVDRPEDLSGLWQTAMAVAGSDTRLLHVSPVLILEEELQGDPRTAVMGLGDYVAVEALTADGTTTVLTVTDKLPLSPPFRENAAVMPSAREPETLAAIERCVLHAHRALGITFGLSHTEVKLTSDGPQIIEVNGRIGGGVMEQLRLAGSYEVVLDLARVSIGASPRLDLDFTGHAGDLFPQPPPGRYRVVRGPSREKLTTIPEIVTVQDVAAAGDVLDSSAGTASHLLRVQVRAPSHAALVRLARSLGSTEFFELQELP